ncbi:MAG: hypothetical protein P9X24_16505 [Candidatus Hatepunaea meridiana]|nr:hypothetical protein [Candidatus Hatepunaea meridiana]
MFFNTINLFGLFHKTIEIHPKQLFGNWRIGWALDLHTTSSTLIDDGIFDTKRTDIGELLYQLKYRRNKRKVKTITESASNFLKSQQLFPSLAAIIPVPPSEERRSFQPVKMLAIRIGKKTGLTVIDDYIIKVKKTAALKNIEELSDRKQQLEGAFKVKYDTLKGKNVLLFDDLYRSGATLNAITDILLNEGQVSDVFVLTITKTRTKR